MINFFSISSFFLLIAGLFLLAAWVCVGSIAMMCLFDSRARDVVFRNWMRVCRLAVFSLFPAMVLRPAFLIDSALLSIAFLVYGFVLASLSFDAIVELVDEVLSSNMDSNDDMQAKRNDVDQDFSSNARHDWPGASPF